MAEEEKHEESKHEEHKPAEGGAKGGGIGESFKKHKTLWIVGGVGAAGVLLLLFMNSGGGSSSSTTPTSSGTTDMNTQGAGGAVDTSSLVGTGGYPSWYNPGAAENLDYWPYVPTSSTGSSSSSGSGSSKHHKGSGSSSSSSGSSKSGSGSSKSGKGSKGNSGGVTHGTGSSHHGVSSGTKTTTKKNKVSTKPNPHAGGAHGWTYTAKGGENLDQLFKKAWPGAKSNTFGYHYADNAKLLKGMNSNVLKKGQKVEL